MANHDRVILQPSDRLIVQLFSSVSELLDAEFTFSVAGVSARIKKDDDSAKKILKDNLLIISNGSVNSGGITVSYQSRSIPNNNSLIPHPYYSTIRINVNEHQRPSDEMVLETHVLIGKFLSKNNLMPSNMISDSGSEISPNIAVLAALQTSAADQIARTNDFFASLAEKFDQRNSELEDRYRSRVEQLESEFSERESALQTDRSKLEELRKELDDRNNTHARRAIRGELIQTIQNRQKSFSISPETARLRSPIHFIFLSLLFITITGVIWSLYVWSSNPTDIWGAMTVTSAIKTAVFTFGFLTSAGLYISWMNRWFDKHAEAQFQTKQFEIDINRATWAVEAALEWKNIQGEQMPDALLAGITKHLFENTPGETDEYSPLEAIASSILGSAANLKLNLNGSEVALDRKSIKQIRTASDS
ncbi:MULTISPECIES: hypothetical protein [unclassified Chelatococcus]|uniref:hypothetical protein n=1 Tax=unclassified Chelatococcus TaxID=2638111 RepID=UPI000AD96799|nr:MULTISPECIES: hypothetical protein [unclassified Chelatococcus]